MHYDVEGNLSIDITKFNEEIEKAREKLESFEKDFKKLSEIKSSNQMETLIDTVQKIREEIKGTKTESESLTSSLKETGTKGKQAIKDLNNEATNLRDTLGKIGVDYKKLANSVSLDKVDNTKQMNNLKKEFEEVKNEANVTSQKMIEDFEKSTTDMSESTKKSTNQITESFDKMNTDVSSDIAKINSEITKLESQLNKAYLSLEKYYEKYNLYANREGHISRSKSTLSSSIKRGVWGIPRRNVHQHGYNERLIGDVYSDEEINEQDLYAMRRDLLDELNLIESLKQKINELNKEKEKLLSSSSHSEKLMHQLNSYMIKIKELKNEMHSLLHDVVVDKFERNNMIEDGIFDTRFSTEKFEEVESSLKELFEEFSETHLKIKSVLNELESDYGITLDNISEITNEKVPLTSKKLTEGFGEAINAISPTLDRLEREIKKTKKQLTSELESYEKTTRGLTFDAMHDGMLKRRKNGEYYNNRKTQRVLTELKETQEYLGDSVSSRIVELADKLKILEDEFKHLNSLKETFLEGNVISRSGLADNIDYLERKMKDVHGKMFSMANSAQNSRKHRDVYANGEVDEYGIEHYKNPFLSESYNEDLKAQTKELMRLRDEYKKLESQLNSFKQMYDLLGKGETNVWLNEQIALNELLMNSLMETIREVEQLIVSEEKMKETSDIVWNTERVESYYAMVNDVASLNTKVWKIDQLEDYYAMVMKITGASREELALLEKQVMLEKELYSAENKYFNLTSPLSRQTNMWVHEELESMRNFMKNVALTVREEQESIAQAMNRMFGEFSMENIVRETKRYENSLKSASQSTNIWVHEQIVLFNQFARAVQKANAPLEVLTTDFNKVKTSASTNVWVHEQIEQFNQFARAVQKACSSLEVFTTDFGKISTSSSTNVWVHEQIEQFNQFAKAVQESATQTERNIKRIEKVFGEINSLNISNDIGNAKGVFSLFDSSNSTVYSKNAEMASRATYKLEESLTSMGIASETAGSRVSTLGGILRTLRTTLSMIGGMFIWDFAFRILDATKATISAKSEMESFFTVLKWGASDIKQFNSMLDDTIKLFPKMNKFQLGETVASLGVEFNLNNEEMAQVAKVAPMIVNEYLRAGRKTEEAILAIKDISQGEFLRLSRETGVGQEELKKAGWNGDNKDIINLYEALEKVGKSRHWDEFASKATSIDDVMLITENRMTEFATMVSEWFTPLIVNSFNALGGSFEGARHWLENLSPLESSILHLTTGLAGLGAVVWGVESKLVPALKNIGASFVSNFMGIDKTILLTHGLSTAVAQQTIVEKARNIALREGNIILDTKIKKGIAEAEASKLGMKATELQTVYEKIYAKTLNVTQKEMKLTDAQTKARKLSQEALLLAEKENITVEEAHTLIMQREKIANMGALKSIVAYKLGLDMQVASELGIIKAIGVKIGVVEAEATATEIATSVNWLYLASLTALSVELAVLAGAIVLVVADFLDLCKSYDEFNDRLENGKDNIAELEKKEKAYEQTIHNLENKTNRTSEETKKLKEARDGLKYTTKLLDKTEREYYKSLSVSNYFEKAKTDSEGKRADILEKRLEDIAKKEGKDASTYVQEYNAELTRAEAQTYESAQRMAWRADKFEKDLKKLNNPRVINEYAKVYDEYEKADIKINAPDSSAMDRFFGGFEKGWAGLQLEFLKFDDNPQKATSDFLNDFNNDFNYTIDSVDKYFLDVIGGWVDSFNFGLDNVFKGLAVGENGSIIQDFFSNVGQWVLDSIGSAFSGSDIGHMLLGDMDLESWVMEQLMNLGAFLNFAEKIDLSGLLDVSEEGIFSIGDKLWTMIDNYLTNHVPLYGWIKNLLPDDEATNQGQQTGQQVVSGVKTGIAPIDNLLRDAGNLWGSISNNNGQKIKNNTKTGVSGIDQIIQNNTGLVSAVLNGAGIRWGSLGNLAGGKAKSGVQKGSKGMHTPVSSEISDISSQLNNAGGDWFSKALNSAKQIISGLTQGLNRHSPGDGAKTVLQEMIDAGMFIDQQSSVLYTKSQDAGKSIVQGMSDMNLGQQLSNAYNTMTNTSNGVMGLNQTTMTDTIGTYDYLTNQVNSTFNNIGTTITGTDKQINSAFDSMNLNATQSFNQMSANTTSTMQNTATTNQKSLNSMQSTTLKVTKSMVSAWESMRANIVSSANYIQTTSYNRFASLHRSISSFYNQLANAKFSAGLPAGLANGRKLRIGTNRNTGGKIRSKTPKNIGNVYGSKNTSLRQAHIDRIKNTSNSWEIGDPWFLGIRIPMNNKVKDFENGKSVRVNANNFESILRDVLTARGFANPNTYQYYANSRRSNQQVWDDVRCNCYDGAEMIVEIGRMLGLPGHLVHGSWKGEGHMGAIVGGKLYDMTQFQKRGVFRGTSGVTFGTRGGGASRGASEREVTKKEININVVNDLSNARIYGIDDLDNHIKNTTKETFYELHSEDEAIGY